MKTAEASVWPGGCASRPGAGSLGPTSAHCSPMWGRAAPRLAVRTGRKGTEASQVEKRQENPQAGLSLVEMDTCYLRMETTPGGSRA